MKAIVNIHSHGLLLDGFNWPEVVILFDVQYSFIGDNF